MGPVIKLRKGATYYHAAFFDRDLRIPSIDTYIYEGFDEDVGHLFLDAATHVAQQDGKKSSDGHYLSFQDGDIHDMLDKPHLIDWLKEEHSPQQVGPTYEYEVE